MLIGFPLLGFYTLKKYKPKLGHPAFNVVYEKETACGFQEGLLRIYAPNWLFARLYWRQLVKEQWGEEWVLPPKDLFIRVEHVFSAQPGIGIHGNTAYDKDRKLRWYEYF